MRIQRIGMLAAAAAALASFLVTAWPVAGDPEVNLKLELWRRNMGIVYGDSPSAGAFIEQTYLVSLAKIIIYLKLTGNRSCTKMQLRDVLSGHFFSSNGIINLIEEDFFVWILR